MTREQAWKKAIDDALAHFGEKTKWKRHGVTVSTDDLLHALHTGLLVVREKLEADTMRTNDLTQLIAVALDCLGAAYYDAAERGEEPKRPSEVRN